MATIYLIRHAQADSTVTDQAGRPLTPKGVSDSLLLSALFKSIEIDAVYSSPYKRTIDTVAQISESHHLSTKSVEDLRGLRLRSEWIDSYRSFFLPYWNDFTYHYSDGESFGALQNRSLRVMEKIIVEMGNKTAVLCTHSVLMAVILKQYDHTFGFAEFMRIAQEEPCIIKLEINNSGCASVEKVKFP